MCGIAGIWGRSEPAVAAAIGRKLSHRGPDGRGHFTSRFGTLEHRRLAIIDLAGGGQPILNENRSMALVANSEVYNSKGLHDELASHHRFRTRCDSEAILHLYEDLGPAVTSRLDGMYAFAIANGPTLFAARDPLGIKPLYYVRTGDTFVFGSEIKALNSWPSQIREFPPGSFLGESGEVERFYEARSSAFENGSSEEHARLLRGALEAAITKRLRSDVPVGAFLSGGLDSSIITALAKRQLPDLHTASVGFAESTDLEAARVVAAHLGTKHREYRLAVEEIAEALPEIIFHLESFDVDLVRSAIPCYFASRLAAQDVKVVLTGEGADELFAGYDYHRQIDSPSALHDELRESVTALHNMNLQRVDRMTMAHSIEGRVPFLDLGVVDVAQDIPPEMKLRGQPAIEKWILRRACDDLLPPEILWRRKAQFDVGSGTTDVLNRMIKRVAVRHGVNASDATTPRQLEARVYHTLYRREFPPETDRLVAHWRGSFEAMQPNDSADWHTQDV